MVVADLKDTIGSQRHEGEVLPGTPTALRARDAIGVGDRPVRPLPPRMLRDRAFERGQFFDERGPAGGGETRADTDVLKSPLVIQTEEERPDQRLLGGARLVQPVAGEDDIGGARVLDLEHRAAIGRVCRVARLRDNAVQAGAFELFKPGCGLSRVRRRAGEVDRAVLPSEGLFEGRPALVEGGFEEGALPQGEEVESDERGGRLLGKHRDPGGRRVDPFLKNLKLEAVTNGDEDLAIEDTLGWGRFFDRGDQLREVPGQRLGVAGGQLDLIAIPEDEAAESVPLRFEGEPLGELRRVGDAAYRLRQHRLYRRQYGKVHRVIVGRRGPATVVRRACAMRRGRRAAGRQVVARPGDRRRAPAPAEEPRAA